MMESELAIHCRRALYGEDRNGEISGFIDGHQVIDREATDSTTGLFQRGERAGKIARRCELTLFVSKGQLYG